MIDELSDEEVYANFQHRLMSVFTLAEQHIIHCLGESGSEDVRSSISKNKAFCQSVCTEIIFPTGGEIRYGYVSSCLGWWLTWLYASSAQLMPSHLIERFKQEPVIFPKQADIDWEELLYRFLNLQNSKLMDGQGLIPDSFIEKALATEFYNVARFLALAEQPFDQAILNEGFTRLAHHLSRYYKIVFECYWDAFDNPPYRESILKIRERTGRYRFTLHQFQQTGFRSDTPDIYRQVLTEEYLSMFLAGFVKSHELKEQQLVARVELENFRAAEALLEESPHIPRSANSDTPPPNPPPSLPPKLTVRPDKIEALVEALKPYVVSGLDALKGLLAMKDVDEKVVIRGRPANALVYVFRQALDADYISNTKADITRWLISWFLIEVKGTQKGLKYDYVYESLSKGTKPARTSRIDYKP